MSRPERVPLSILDLATLRTPEGIALVKESQRRRFRPTEIVDAVIALEMEWRDFRRALDGQRQEYNRLNREIGTAYLLGRSKSDKEEDLVKINDLIAAAKVLDTLIQQGKNRESELKSALDIAFNSIGNLVADDVPISDNESDNRVIRTWISTVVPTRSKLEHHHELLAKIGGYLPCPEIAGHRGYFLTGIGVRLNRALIAYSLDFLAKRQFLEVQPPYYMRDQIMAKTAQLADFDEQLYGMMHHKDEPHDYLIATSEQPISAMHMDQRFETRDLPKRYAGYSTNFRKEAGGHGRDVWGIFRVHQFDKVEQFVLCTPDESEQRQQEMICNAQDFNESLGISYQVVSIVSGVLNDAAIRKYDLEGWFPSEEKYRELVSCSNCTDYQSRRLNIRYGPNNKYVHMLNATLCATTRTICAILENYQTDTGITVPEVLRPYLGLDFIPFTQ